MPEYGSSRSHLLISATMLRAQLRHYARRNLHANALKDIQSKYVLGADILGYKVEQVEPILEFSLVAVKLKHGKTGLEHLHLDASHDNNNVFLIAFKTNPPDNTGVPHILEHTTLCGSEKYPVRDPFFKMLNRSLSNFMNAMTGHDYTYYPFATTNSKDFDNLMDVYLSSVLEPKLAIQDFMQEGWRLENEVTTDSKSPIIFKGVVFNEMKGQYSNSGYYFWIKFQEAIYASLNNSGGDPSKIVTLQYEDLVDFHLKNYHPSNARTFTYGSLPLRNHLRKLDEFLVSFGKRQRNTDVKLPIFEKLPHKKEFNVEVPGPVDTMSSKPVDQQYKSSISWYLGNPLNESSQYDMFKWKVLSSLLCDGHNAPFFQQLIELEYGDDFTINSGLDATTALLTFTVGVSNLSVAKAHELPQKVVEITKNHILPEFDSRRSSYENRVQALLHQIELGFKKHKPDFGLGLLHSIVPNWVNGFNPISSIKVEEILSRFKNEYKESGLKMFTDMIEKTILNDETPVFKFVMVPDAEFSNKLTKDEKQLLDSKVSQMSPEDKQAIFDRGLKLAESQQAEQDISVLPSLTLRDIPRYGEQYALRFSEINLKKYQQRIVDTNGLTYVTAAKDLSYLPTKYYKYMPIFASCLTNLAGTAKTSITDLETRIQQTTGGISFSFSNKTDPYNIMKTNLKFVLSGMSLADNTKHVYDLWHEILTSTKFNADDEVVDKLSTLVKSIGQSQMNTIADRGHSFAGSYSSSQLTPTKYISEQTGGLAQAKFVMELNHKLDQSGKQYLVEELLPILRDIQDHILNGHSAGGDFGFNYSVVADKNGVAQNDSLVKEFDDKIVSAASKKSLENQLSTIDLGVRSKNLSTLVNMPFQVGYSSLAKLGAEYTSKDGAALQVLSQLLTFKHLHSVIRESNGAYGGGLMADGLSGIMNYYSYRDPNCLKSVSNFRDSGKFALTKLVDFGSVGAWTVDDLQEAKLSIFQSVDAPSNISSQGSSNFIEGITDDMKQERRENFLDTSSSDLIDVTNKYLVDTAEVATIIGDNAILQVDSTWKVNEMGKGM